MTRKADYVKVSPEIRPETMEWWRRYFPNNNNAAGWAIEEIPHQVRHTLAEMRGHFTAGELWMMVDVMNGHAMNTFGQYGSGGRHINLSIQDSFELYPGVYEEKWAVEKDAMIDKLLRLSRWQLTCLEIWISGFWNRDEHGNAPANKEYIATLAADDKEGKS